jgi:hypothetical protein
VHVPPSPHGCGVAHSLMLVHVRPLPVVPGLHAQVNEPGVSVHVASAAQSCMAVVHSLRLVQPVPAVKPSPT